MSIVGNVAVDKITSDDENVGVLFFEPCESGAGESNSLFVSDVEVGEESYAITREFFWPAGDSEGALLGDESIGFDECTVGKSRGTSGEPWENFLQVTCFTLVLNRGARSQGKRTGRLGMGEERLVSEAVGGPLRETCLGNLFRD